MGEKEALIFMRNLIQLWINQKIDSGSIKTDERTIEVKYSHNDLIIESNSGLDINIEVSIDLSGSGVSWIWNKTSPSFTSTIIPSKGINFGEMVFNYPCITASCLLFFDQTLGTFLFKEIIKSLEFLDWRL